MVLGWLILLIHFGVLRLRVACVFGVLFVVGFVFVCVCLLVLCLFKLPVCLLVLLDVVFGYVLVCCLDVFFFSFSFCAVVS